VASVEQQTHTAVSVGSINFIDTDSCKKSVKKKPEPEESEIQFWRE
jgi:hypothetical protein